MAESNHYSLISNWSFQSGEGQKQSSRIGDVIDYVLKNIDKEIHLADLAKLTCLPPASFGQFFKNTTHTSFSHYLKQMRIAKACQLLVETEDPITEIALSCGFQNLSNFNRQFLELKQTTPSQFRKFFLVNKVEQSEFIE